MPECFGVPVVTMLVCFFHSAYEAAGAQNTRHSLRPLFSKGDVVAKLGRKLRRGNTVSRLLRSRRPPCAQLRTEAGDPVSRRRSCSTERPLAYWTPRISGGLTGKDCSKREHETVAVPRGQSRPFAKQASMMNWPIAGPRRSCNVSRRLGCGC